MNEQIIRTVLHLSTGLTLWVIPPTVCSCAMITEFMNECSPLRLKLLYCRLFL